MSEKQVIQSTKLSPSWVIATDPDSGRSYYANVKTKEVSWTKPSEQVYPIFRDYLHMKLFNVVG